MMGLLRDMAWQADRERLFCYRVQSEIVDEMFRINDLGKFFGQCSMDVSLTARLRARCTRWSLLSRAQQSALLRDVINQKADMRLRRAQKIMGGTL
jgi:hypothetical protein